MSEQDIPDGITPQSINPLGNYAVQITWEDGFNQVRPRVAAGPLRRMRMCVCAGGLLGDAFVGMRVHGS